MNTPALLFFTALTTAPIPAFGSDDSNCPSGLPAELFIECNIADGSASSLENGPAHIGAESYNVTEQLQAWIERKMQRDVARENTEPTGTDIARQLDEH